MKALIFNGEVIQIETKEFEVHSDFKWVDCNETVKVGWNYDGTNFTDSDTTTDAEKAEIELDELRRKRNLRLQESDWTQIPDSALSSEQKTSWATYRQELRDITNTYKSRSDDGFQWPTIIK